MALNVAYECLQRSLKLLPINMCYVLTHTKKRRKFDFSVHSQMPGETCTTRSLYLTNKYRPDFELFQKCLWNRGHPAQHYYDIFAAYNHNTEGRIEAVNEGGIILPSASPRVPIMPKITFIKPQIKKTDGIDNAHILASLDDSKVVLSDISRTTPSVTHYRETKLNADSAMKPFVHNVLAHHLKSMHQALPTTLLTDTIYGDQLYNSSIPDTLYINGTKKTKNPSLPSVNIETAKRYDNHTSNHRSNENISTIGYALKSHAVAFTPTDKDKLGFIQYPVTASLSSESIPSALNTLSIQETKAKSPSFERHKDKTLDDHFNASRSAFNANIRPENQFGTECPFTTQLFVTNHFDNKYDELVRASQIPKVSQSGNDSIGPIGAIGPIGPIGPIGALGPIGVGKNIYGVVGINSLVNLSAEKRFYHTASTSRLHQYRQVTSLDDPRSKTFLTGKKGAVKVFPEKLQSLKIEDE